MYKSLLFLFVCILLSSCGHFEPQSHGIVTATKLNIRDRPSAQSEVIGQIEKGEKVVVNSLGKKYANVHTKYGQGFVSMDYIRIENGYSFSSFLKTTSMREIISILIPFLIIALLTIRILSYFLSKLSSLDYNYAPRFNFFLTNRNGFFRRRFNSTVYLMLGRRTQHPYLNYWIFTSLFWFLIPVVFFGGHYHFIFFFESIKNITLMMDSPIKFGIMIIYILTPGVIFIVKAVKNSKLLPTKEWIFVLLALLFSLFIMFVSMILALRWLVIIMLNIFIFFAGSFSKSDRRYIQYINGGDPGDVAM